MALSHSPTARRILLGIGLLVLALAFPWVLKASLSDALFATWSQVAVMAIYFAVAAVGLNVMVGYTGLLTLGYGGFMLIGCYTAAILMKGYGWSFWLALPAGGVHAALWGVILGMPTLRLKGDYFAIVTFGFGELVNMTARNWVSLTRGPAGYPGVPAPRFGWDTWAFTFDASPEKRWAYMYVAFALLGACIILTSRLSRSRLGRAWAALREDETAAEACGIYPAGYKTVAFAVSAFIGGLAGAFYAAYNGNADYRNFDFMTSIIVLAFVVFGGLGTSFGPVVGAIILYCLGEVLRLRRNPAAGLSDYLSWWPAAQTWVKNLPWAPEMRMIVFGLVLLVVVRLRPSGLLPARPAYHGTENTRGVAPELFSLPPRPDRNSLGEAV